MMAVKGDNIRSSILLVVMVYMISRVEAQPRGSLPTPSCLNRCGDVEVPYPFGFRDDERFCYLHSAFSLKCDRSYNPPKPFQGDFEVTNIALASGHLRILIDISYTCYNASGIADRKTWKFNFVQSTYTPSQSENVFKAIGCDTFATFDIRGNTSGGCYSGCDSMDIVADDGDCSGIGCCEASIPKGLSSYNTSFNSFFNHSNILGFNPCSYSFLVERGNYTFRKSDIRGMDKKRLFPVVLDWYIGNQSCEEAKKNTTGYACVSGNSDCVDSSNGPGYLCNCSRGYQGNPYIQNGCADIDECKGTHSSCSHDCINTAGSYYCSCREGYYSNDQNRTCILSPGKQGLTQAVKLFIGIGSGVFLLFLVTTLVYFGAQKRKIAKLKKMYFEQNGGFFLERDISSHHTSTFKIYSLTELEDATNNFDKDRILGRGGFGTVYKGILDNDQVVAIKKSMMIDEKQSKDFANEMFILSQINHKNVVKLLGCCLEVDVPMLVYEYIPNGTLFNYIHNEKHRIPFSLGIRLKIATEAAEALRYLHIDASPPILHGDIKSSNILLDENYTAKVSDFGTSTLASKDRSQFTTLVQGTYGYLDPEYLQTSQLTDKSDVYSFGVVLMELLTRKKPFYFEGTEDEKCLAFNFISCMNDNRVTEILDPDIMEGGLPKEVKKLTEMAMQCLSVKGNERPSMKDIVMELEVLRGVESHPWTSPNSETMYLLRDQLVYSHDMIVEDQTILDTEDG